MTGERDDHHLRVMIERMQREGYSEREIVREVELAQGRPDRPERRPLRKAVRVGRWRVEVARL
jgi:hypothetical protein